ncbi:MAG: hypothetical protein RIS35_2209, partial [Pseudomonadota bacterium]
EHRWLIAAVAALVAAFGGLYAWMATPIYESNTLIQVEDIKASPMSGALGEAQGLFEVRSQTSAEIEILRSRLVVGQAAENLQLDLGVSPKYLPVIGRWLSGRASAPSEPGFFGMSGYVSGNEALQIAAFEIPRELEGRSYAVVLTPSGYALRSPEGTVLGEGRPGEPLEFTDAGSKGRLTVANAVGKPGAEFLLRRASRLGITESLQGRLKIVEQGRQSGVLRVSLEDDDPVRAARILNEIGMLYVRQNVERKSAEAEKTLAFLNTQLPQLRRELESSEKKFNQFRSQNRVFDLGGEATSLLDQTVNLRVKLLELDQKKKELEARYTAQHPSVRTIDAQIRELQGRIGEIEGRAKSLPRVEQDLLSLTRDVKVNNELYTGLLNSFQQLRLVKEGKVGNVRIVDPAMVPELSVKPQKSRIVGIAAVLGLLAGVGLAFLRNALRPGIREAGEIEQRLGQHVFANVPLSPEQGSLTADMNASKSGQHLLAVRFPESLAVESLRSLRTAMQFAMLDAQNNLVLVTGATPGVGKSFMSANFAAVLAAGGRRVLLIDADIRKGHIHRYFGLERGKGLSEAIAGTIGVDQAIHRAVVPNLDVITTGALPPNPAEMLMSPAAAERLHAMAAEYDVVIVDSPPVLPVADTLVLAPLAGTVFMVARAEISTLGELEESAKRLSQSGVNVRGVIFNGMDFSRRRYGYGYGSGYGRNRYRYRAYHYGAYRRSNDA